MSKVKLIFLILVACSIGLFGCGRDKSLEDKPVEGSNNDKYLDDKSEETLLDDESESDDELEQLEKLEQLEGVWLETEYQSYEVGVMSVRVKWYNSLDDDMMFGEFFELEEKINGSWEKVSKETDVNYGFNALGYGLVSNQSRWHTYNLIPYTDGLSPGEYRISTSFMRETLDGNDYGSGNYPDYQVCGYFNVGDKMIKRDLSVLDDSKIEYLNEEYHFGIYLPREWEGLQAYTSKETGDKDLDELFTKIDEEFIVMNIRHPKWTEEEPRQDISFAIFEMGKWNENVESAVDGDFDLLPLNIPGGGNKFILGSNPIAYKSSLKGYSEVVEIIGDGYLNSSIHDY